MASSAAVSEKKEILTGKRRMASLARPKPLPAGFIDDRRTVYFENNKLVKSWENGDVNTKCDLTDRLEQLVQPKPQHKEWEGDQPTPIWKVSAAAKQGNATKRLNFLARPKQHVSDWQPDRSMYSRISSAAKCAEPSARIEQLARHKVYAELTCNPDLLWDWGVGESEISQAALDCIASDRIQSLAVPKETHRGYKDPRNVEWRVSDAARATVPNARIQKLARPKSKSMYMEDYKPSWWKVSSGARLATANERLEELATPIPRKVRQKKNAPKT